MITDKPDIVEIISRYVDLKQRGQDWWGICPFHNDSDPSFKVSPSHQKFYCFGCHAKGDVIEFVMRYEHVSFIEACTALGIERSQGTEALRQSQYIIRAEQEYRAWLREWFLKWNFIYTGCVRLINEITPDNFEDYADIYDLESLAGYYIDIAIFGTSEERWEAYERFSGIGTQAKDKRPNGSDRGVGQVSARRILPTGRNKSVGAVGTGWRADATYGGGGHNRVGKSRLGGCDFEG